MGGLAIRIHSEPLPLVTKLVPGLSPAVDAWFQRACSRPVPDRFNTAKEMAEALAAALGGQMPRSVGVPKSSTGSNRHDPMVHEPTLATTDAGLSALSRSTPPNNATRNRLLALGGVGAVLAFSAFFGVSYLKKGTTTTSSDGKALSSVPAPLPPPSALSVVVPPPNPPTSLSPIPPPPPEPAAAPVPPSPVAKPGHRPKPPTSSASPVTHPPLPSPSPTPAPGPAPASTRDIF
jgi:serine/threonine-protein kinase